MKMTPSGIDPATFQFVAQYLNQPLRHRVPLCVYIYSGKNGDFLNVKEPCCEGLSGVK
jgi:hypothetical protein